MATYYVDSANGSDANNGLGPDASHASNKPFATVGKLIAASGVMVSGDQAYLAPGTYREAVAVGVTSFASETKITADPTNGRGFKTSGGALVAPGAVRWTNYTTNDTTAASGTLLNLSGRDFLTVEGVWFVNGTTGATVSASTSTSTDIKFTDCVFQIANAGSSGHVLYTSAAGTAGNWTIDRCVFVTAGRSANPIDVTATVHSSEYNLAFLVQNCLFLGGAAAVIVRMGSASSPGGGVTVTNCTAHGEGLAQATGTNVPATNKLFVYNSVAFSNTALNAAASGQITENYNVLYAATARTNVSTGANSVSNGSYAPLLDVGQWAKFGQRAVPFLMPTVGSPLLGFGSTGSPPSVDYLNRPRPAGGASTSNGVGYAERHDTAMQETTTVDASGSGLVLTGPADQDIHVPVNAASTTITVKVRYDTTHATTNKPQAILLANAAIGVATETKTMTSGVDTWETLTFSAFTPTAKGVVTVRLVSRSAGGGGKAFFDSLTVA